MIFQLLHFKEVTSIQSLARWVNSHEFFYLSITATAQQLVTPHTRTLCNDGVQQVQSDKKLVIQKNGGPENSKMDIYICLLSLR